MAKIVLSESQERRLSRMLRWFEGQYGTSGDSSAGGAKPLLESSDTFYNDSSETIPPYSVIELKTGGRLSDGTANNVGYVKASKPTSTEGDQYAVNGAVHVAPGKYGQCFTSGSCLFNYDTGTPAVGDEYGPEASKWTAKKDGSPGFIKCIGLFDTTNKIAKGLLNVGSGSDIVCAVLDEDLTYGGTADASEYTSVSPDGGTDTTNTIADCWTFLLSSGKKLSSGFHVEVEKSSKRVIACRECPVDA